MADEGEKSWILHHILDRMIGSREKVAIRRKMVLVEEYVKTLEFPKLNNLLTIFTGSRSEGFAMKGSDIDIMAVSKNIEVICPSQTANIPSDNEDMTILLMRKDNCRHCYVTLEVAHLTSFSILKEALVSDRDKRFISSEKVQHVFQTVYNADNKTNIQANGPASSLKKDHTAVGCDIDMAISFRCKCWPPAANEWLSRTRHHGWPQQTLIYNISINGCHVVPVGDKTSARPSLQWRISFATAERKLVYSLSHQQFLVYGLLKIFLKHISGALKKILNNEDIISSYIMKTALFFAVESTPLSFWKEQNTFTCFMLCLKTLINWVKTGYCPNYFIVSNNMFKGKLNDSQQEKLLRFLMVLHDMEWLCLFIGTFWQPSVGVHIRLVMNGEWKHILLAPKVSEYECDVELFGLIFHYYPPQYHRSLALLNRSRSDTDEFIAYFYLSKSLSCLGVEAFEERYCAMGNKEMYKYLRKCKHLMIPLAALCTSPGLLVLATYFYQTGNYVKALMACGEMLSSFKLFIKRASSKDYDKYTHLFCGHGYSLLYKCREAIVSRMVVTNNFSMFFPSHLHQHFSRVFCCFDIPPLPYAVFLSFLCYHELGDKRRCDTALNQLRVVKYDEHQGGSQYWIVHHLLGICYEMVGDTRRAINEYRESLSGGRVLQQHNLAREHITRLLQSGGESL